MSERPTVRDRILQEMAESAGRRGADPDEAIVRTAIDMAVGGGRLAHDALDRLIDRASPSVETETWRPMETAPKNGTEILAAVEVYSGGRSIGWERHVVWADDDTDGIHPDAYQGWEWDDYTLWTDLPPAPSARTPSTGQHDKHSKACQHRNSTGQEEGT